MTITVKGETYFVAKGTGTPVCIKIAVYDWKIFKRRKHETNKELEARIIQTLADLSAVRARVTPCCACHASRL